MSLQTNTAAAQQTILSPALKWAAFTVLIVSLVLLNTDIAHTITNMPPVFADYVRRNFDPGEPSKEFANQWSNPGDVFSVLLILGGDVVGRALAQLAGSPLTPVAFSFGWVAYAITAVVSAVGENKLMPLPDCACKVINGKSGYIRDNTSWVIGRIVRDFETWKDYGRPDLPVQTKYDSLIQGKWDYEKDLAENKKAGSGDAIKKPMQAGLCVSVYEAGSAKKGYPGFDLVYYIGFLTTFFQLGIAAIPAGAFGDWSIFLVTFAGIFLSLATGSLPQWAKEKWACRDGATKNVVLTRGNGSQHAIIVLGTGKGLDLEDLAAGQTNVDTEAGWFTRIATTALAIFWVLLLITAAGIKQNTWFLLAIGGVGILQNIFVAGWKRTPAAYGIPLQLVDVIGEAKVMDTLFAVENKYPFVGASMVETFFPGKLRADEQTKWADYAKSAKDREKALKTSPAATDGISNGASLPAAQPNSTTTTTKA